MKKGLERGNGIAIGHVGIQGENTSQSITSSLPVLHRSGIQIVHVSKLLSEGNRNK